MRYEDRQAIIFLRHYEMTAEMIASLLLLPFKQVRDYIREYDDERNGQPYLFWNRPRQSGSNSSARSRGPSAELDVKPKRKIVVPTP